jgi:hypothetical protein
MGERTLQKGIFERTEEEVQGNTFTFSALAIGKCSAPHQILCRQTVMKPAIPNVSYM